MKIVGLQKVTLIDYPGKIACTVFLAGCPFRCPWCYNASLVLPEKIKEQPEISSKEIFRFLAKRKNNLEGVVLSGGEPTINPEVFDLCQRIKKMGYQIKLDTNGVNPEMVRSLIRQRLIDYVAMDIKAPKERYMETIGLKTKIGELGETRLKFWSDNIIRNIEKTIKILKKGDLEFEFRTTFVPGFLKKKDVLKIAQWIGPAPRYFLQEFKPGETLGAEFRDKKIKETQELVDILKSIRPFFDVCQLRTR